MIAADALMIIRGLVLIESIRGKVQHTIVKGLVTQDEFIGLRLLLWCLTLRLRYEHLIVEITFVHRPQVHKTQHEEDADSIFLLQLPVETCQKNTRTDQDDIERTHGIGCKHGLTHLCEVGNQRLDMFGRKTLQGTHLTGGDETVEEERGHQ